MREAEHTLQAEVTMKPWECQVCGFLYEDARGVPERGIPPGTPWERIPDVFRCPGCGVGKEDFDPKGRTSPDDTFADL